MAVWDVSEVSFDNVVASVWDVSSLTFDVTQGAGAVWDVSSLTVDVTGDAPAYEIRLSDGMTITDSVNENMFSYKEQWTIADSMTMTDTVTLNAQPRFFFAFTDAMSMSDTVTLQTSSTLITNALSDQMNVVDSVRLLINNAIVIGDTGLLPESTLERLHYAYAMQMDPNVALSTTDLAFKYFSERSGLVVGSLADHRAAWLRSKGYNDFYSYLEGLGYKGDISDKFRAYWAGFTPRENREAGYGLSGYGTEGYGQ